MPKVFVLVLLLSSLSHAELTVTDAEDMLTCLNLFEYHSQRLLALTQMSTQQLRAFVLSYVHLCREHLLYPGDYTKHVTYLGGVATPLFPQEQYLSLKLV